MPLRAFLIAAILMLQAMLVPVPALATSTWGDDITMRVENDGTVSVVDLRTYYGPPDDQPLTMEWSLVEPGTEFGAGTHEELEVGEVVANDDLLPYRRIGSVDDLEAGDYAVVENERGTSVVLRLKHPDDGEITFRASYRLAGAVRRWSDAGEARLRLWNPTRDWKQDLNASFELLFPNDEDGRRADTPADLQAWNHVVRDWADEDEVSPITVEPSHGTYGAQDSAYLQERMDHEVRALFPATLLYKMDPLPQSKGKEVRAQEEAAAEAYDKKLEEEREQRDLEWEARQSAHDLRVSVEVPLFLISSIGMGAYCIYRARRFRRAYDQSHLQHVTDSWRQHMLAKNRPRRNSGDPKSEAVGDSMLSDDAHPLIVGWALTGGPLPYSAIAATLARLSPLGVVEIAPVLSSRPKWLNDTGLSCPAHSMGFPNEWMLVFHKERFGLVSDPLDRAVLDMFETFADTVSRNEYITSQRSFVSTHQGECFLLSDLRRITMYSSNYLRELRKLRATISKTCHEQGLDDDQETASQRQRLKRLIALYACVFVLGTAVVLVEVPVAFLASPILALIVFPYLLDSYKLTPPLSRRAVQLRSELGRLRLWLHGPDSGRDEASKEFDTQTWQLVLARALVLGEDVKAADRVRRDASACAQNASVQTMLTWCGEPAWGVVWAFENATRRAQRVRSVEPAPWPTL